MCVIYCAFQLNVSFVSSRFVVDGEGTQSGTSYNDNQFEPQIEFTLGLRGKHGSNEAY